MARKKLRESESLHDGFAEDFAAEIERDSWEKGQRAGRWLSQHLYSEREKREMEQKRRGTRPGAKAAEAAQTEAGRGGGAQSTAPAAQSAPEGTQKRTPATGVSAQQNAAWQAAGQSRAGQAPAWLEEFLQMPFESTMDENMAALAQEKTPAQIAREAADAAKARRDSQYRGSSQYGSRGGAGPGDTRTNAQKRAGMLRGEADMAQQRAREADAYAAQLEAEEADAKAALEEKRRAQEQARQAQEEAAARQDPQRKEYWAGQWRSYGQQLDEAKRNGAPQETMYELEAQRGAAYQNYMRLSGQETVARSEQQARQKELAQQAQAGQEAQAAQAGQSSGHEAEAAIQQTEQALTDVRLKIADLRAAGAEYAPGGGYSAPFQAALDEEARLESQLDAQQAQAYQQAQASVNWGTLMEWASSDYEMTDAQKAVTAELVEQWNGTIGPKFDEYYETAQRLHALGQSTETVEMLLLQAEIMDTLATKVSGVRSAFSGAGNALPVVPQIRGALEAENWRRAGFEGENPLGLAQRSQSAATQNPLAYHAGYLASGMGQYAAGSAAMKALPGVGGFLDDAAGALAGTQAAQKLQTVPVLGRLGTQQALAGMLGDSMLDLGLSTIPKGVGLELEYARQQREGLRPGETPLTQSGIFLQLAADAGLNAASGALGELAPAALGALDDLWNGRPVLNAAQQQGFEALRQGMAPSANQQAALHSLWEKAPGYVPAHRGGWGEVPAAPAADAADGFRSGPLALGAAQDAGEAAQRRAFLKWTQGEAMTAQEKALVDGLWNTDPHRASEYWAAGEFLDTEAPRPASAVENGGDQFGTIFDHYFLNNAQQSALHKLQAGQPNLLTPEEIYNLNILWQTDREALTHLGYDMDDMLKNYAADGYEYFPTEPAAPREFSVRDSFEVDLLDEKNFNATIEENTGWRAFIDYYKNRRKRRMEGTQWHHLNQNAAFVYYIPREEAICITLKGNIFLDKGSPHYVFHQEMEKFWDNFREGRNGRFQKRTPFVGEYNAAMYDALKRVGFSGEQAGQLVNRAAEQQLFYGLQSGVFLENVPKKINLRR